MRIYGLSHKHICCEHNYKDNKLRTYIEKILREIKPLLKLHPTGVPQIKTKFLGNADQDDSNANMLKSHRTHSQHLTIVLFYGGASLSDAEMSLLFKGLNFCPTPNEVDVKAVREDART